jgi:hypothetical protein
MANSSASKLSGVGARGYVTKEDVSFLRRNVFQDGIVSQSELDAVFALAERAPKGDAEWPMFFEEAVADYYLREEDPHGYLTDQEFATLKARVTRDGRKASEIELRLLLKLLETATATPAAMTDFVAEQLKLAILDRGPDASVTANDTVLLRRFIFANGGDGNVRVTKREAELLFDISDATHGVGNDAVWTEFFVKAIANHLMSHFTYDAPSRDEALRRQAFFSDQSANVNVGGFFKRMIAGGLSGLKEEKSAQALRNEQRDRDIAVAEKVTPVEADWLADRIGRDGTFHASERALIDYMRDLGAELPPKLKALIDRAA